MQQILAQIAFASMSKSEREMYHQLQFSTAELEEEYERNQQLSSIYRACDRQYHALLRDLDDEAFALKKDLDDRQRRFNQSGEQLKASASRLDQRLQLARNLIDPLRPQRDGDRFLSHRVEHWDSAINAARRILNRVKSPGL